MKTSDFGGSFFSLKLVLASNCEVVFSYVFRFLVAFHVFLVDFVGGF